MAPAQSGLSRLAVAAALAGLAVVVGLVVVVLQFGQKDPSPPSLASHPQAAIPGEVLYLRGDCIVRATASGSARSDVACPGAAAYVSWVDAATARYWRFDPFGLFVVDIDLATGGETVGVQSRDERTAGQPSAVLSPRGEYVTVGDDGSVYHLPSGQSSRGKIKIFDFDGPSNRRPEFLTWSPDGEWVLLYYPGRDFDRGELWIVRRDGTLKGTLATGVSRSASWWIEGAGFLPALP